jgi:hypothetical protein
MQGLLRSRKGAKHVKQPGKRCEGRLLWIVLAFCIAYPVAPSRADAGTISWASIDCTTVPKALDGLGIEPRTLAVHSRTIDLGFVINGPRSTPWHGFITLWINRIRQLSISESVPAGAQKDVHLRVYRIPTGTPMIEVTLDNRWGYNIRFSLCPRVPGNYVANAPGD